ncbi:MbcA/ParS/Xre antitoxin family protein [Xinfangfangia pollutisoli]|uniref:MbcA/ParS/Xre antitoxin family protein n=1 Tax=Xinfangfangia pollutisoli TaxID=2865960 RepID=UPI001CD7BED6|nr:MbcA/ParS/Xre antitoxin family protein [Xinfangfangia pollutisoli]
MQLATAYPPVPPSPKRVISVALKAYARVAEAWGLGLKEAAALADMSESTWKRARKPGFAGELTKDQLLRLSALIGIYKALELYFSEPLARVWFTRPNAGPLFNGARPVDVAIEGGLPQILAVRSHLDALRGGA